MGFPLDEVSSPLPESTKASLLSSWGSDFSSSSSSNPFECVIVGGGDSSPVTVASTLESNSCAGCGLDGKIVKKIKKKNRMFCSVQSKDWINGHSQTCQPFAVVVKEVLL